MSATEELFHALGGKHCGGGRYTALCPAHDDRTPSLGGREGDDGRPVFHCYAGCPQDAVVEALRDRGLWANGERLVPDPQRIEAARALRHAQVQERIEAARRIWERARPAAGTAVEVYLGSRGITVPTPTDLRFAILKHSPSGRRLPCMVAAVRNVRDELVALHRTFLQPGGRSKADVEPVKMAFGPVAGCAVRLAPVTERLLLAEGIESALSAAELAGIGAWSALSANGLERLELPPEAHSVLICADCDANGVGQRAALAAAARWRLEGRGVRVFLPELGRGDFNDQLMSLRAARGERLAS